MPTLVGLAGRGDQRLRALQGGQPHRVALAVDPDLLLLDEPLGTLDLKRRRQMHEALKAIQRRVGTTFVHVTRAQEEAMANTDRIVGMNAGRIEDLGPPRQIYLHPASVFSASFMGEANLIPLRLGPVQADSPLGPLPLTGAVSRTLAIRPEAIGTAGALPLGRARLTDAAFFGTHMFGRISSLLLRQSIRLSCICRRGPTLPKAQNWTCLQPPIPCWSRAREPRPTRGLVAPAQHG